MMALFVFFVAGLAAAAPEKIQTLEIGAPAPDFNLPGVDGKMHTLARAYSLHARGQAGRRDSVPSSGFDRAGGGQADDCRIPGTYVQIGPDFC